MTAARIVRSVSHAVERVTLGLSSSRAPAGLEKPTREDSTREDSTRENSTRENPTREVAELRARLESIDRERERLEQALANNQAELTTARETARQQGYREGAAQAQAEADRALAEQVAHWHGAAGEAAQGFESRLQSIRTELTDVVLAGVAKILGDNVMNPQSVRATMEQVLREAGLTGSVRILIAPAQFEQITKFGSSQIASLRERRVEVAPDARVTSGGCLVETPTGLVDGRFETQLANLKEIVASHYAAGGSPR